MAKKMTLEEIKALYENKNREILCVERREVGKSGNKSTYVKYRCLIKDCDHEDWQALSSMKSGCGCIKCNGTVKLTIEEIKLKLKEINPNIEILSNKYINANTKLKCKCLVDENVWNASWAKLSFNRGCPKCARMRQRIMNAIPNGNSIYDLRPDLIKYFINTQETKEICVKSNKKVKLKCPYCGMLKTKEVAVRNLSNQGFSCDYCSDGISIPEKFGINLLRQIRIYFETQSIFDWSGNKKYDQYFILNNEEFICEIHGGQHYKEIARGRSLKEEQKNDKLKYDLAIQNGIKPENYVVVDARYSEFKWLKENFTKQLSHIFDFSDIDWNKIWEECQSSLVVKVWEAWNNKSEDDTTITVGNMFGLSRVTISRYLKIGVKLNKCKYDSREEMSKRNKIYGKNKNKTVYQFSLNGEYINKFESVNEAKNTQVNSSGISNCCSCNGNNKTAGGFKWSYNPPVNGMYID